MKAVLDVEATAMGLVDAGRHALMGHKEIMQAARAGKPELIGGVEDGGRIPQQLAGMVEGDRLQEGLGAQARPAREQALQMGGAEACLIRQGLERGLVAPVLGNESQRVFDQIVIVRLLFHAPNLVPPRPRNHPFLAQKCGFISAAFRALAKESRSWAPRKLAISVRFPRKRR